MTTLQCDHPLFWMTLCKFGCATYLFLNCVVPAQETIASASSPASSAAASGHGCAGGPAAREDLDEGALREAEPAPRRHGRQARDLAACRAKPRNPVPFWTWKARNAVHEEQLRGKTSMKDGKRNLRRDGTAGKLVTLPPVGPSPATPYHFGQ